MFSNTQARWTEHNCLITLRDVNTGKLQGKDSWPEQPMATSEELEE